MSKPNEERDIYYIPPNFLASGRLFGGMIRARNAIEACVLVLLTGIPIIKLPMSLTVRIIILCLLPLPLGIFGIIGFEGDSLSEFAINWVRWFIHRRNLYRSDVTIPETARKQKKRIWEQEATKPPEELGIRIKQPRKKRKRPTKTEKQLNKNNRKMVPSHKKQVTYSEDFVPVKDIRNGIIETEDGRYIRVLEVEPINFLLRSTSEQKNIVASFASWMKISPIKIQIKVLTKKADIGKHLSTIERDMESESNPKCRELQLDYYRLIQTIGSREAITRRFLVIFEYTGIAPTKQEGEKTSGQLHQTDVDAIKKDVVTRTNTLRLNKGVAVLEVNSLLMDAAQVRADEMAASGAYSHTRPDGRRSNTVTDSRRTGENIHCITELYLEQQHKTLSDAVVNLWSNSKGHADNMLNARYGEIGVGLARGTDSNGLACWYCVQVFLVDGCEVTWVDVPAIG